ncbi:MAG: sigma factor, partial [Solirubrobacteraceae bacterium]
MTTDREPPGSVSTDDLLRRYREAEDPALLEEIVRRFEPLARSVARRYHARGEPLEDLTQVAMVGLLKAISRFDPD